MTGKSIIINKDPDKNIIISNELLSRHFKNIENYMEEYFKGPDGDTVELSWPKEIKERNDDILNDTINLSDRRWEYL